ncbi:hypothetical protein J8M20_16520 [Pseudoalteromonas luteoviolacea]|uniref:hypothetical protein n=1 Tax=Pseudoalteromonas luteoviolacea TaxID=43657 RepID=UPI001B364739|nr:hypothetical protein [Pseudoalteromonas luteoviolacea]MBQ4812967.1 hypothetical protein [Pseudoalteromonas luteoviolacea]
MPKTLTTILLSITAHLLLLFLLSKQVVISHQPTPTPAMKTYLVFEDSEPKPQEITQQSTPPHFDAVSNPPAPEQVSEPQTQPKQSIKTADPHHASPPKQKSEPQTLNEVDTAASEASESLTGAPHFKQLDPYLGLESLRAQQAQISTNISGRNVSPIKHSTLRFTVPADHKNMPINGPKVVTKNLLFTEYQKGDTCFKVMHADPSTPAPEGFSNEWVSLGYKCNNNVIKNTYDAVMNKWLDK